MNALVGCEVCDFGKPSKGSPIDALRNKGIWAEGFHQCSGCSQVYQKGWDRDWQQVTKSPVSTAILASLDKDACVETIWPYLKFDSRLIPVNLYISHGQFDPQELFDRVAIELCQIESTDSEKYYYLDIINKIFDLGLNKYRELLKTQGWLVKLVDNKLLEEIQALANKLSEEKLHKTKYQESLVKFRAEAFGCLEELGKLKVETYERYQFILNFPIKDNRYAISTALEINPPEITNYENDDKPNGEETLDVDIVLLIKTSFKHLLPYHSLLFPIFISAFLMEYFARISADLTMGLSYLFFGGTCSVIYAGIVSKNAGRWPDNSAWEIILERNSCLTDFIFLGFFIALCSSVLYGVLSAFNVIAEDPEYIYLIFVLVIMTALCLAKFWPTFVLAFAFKGKSQWSLGSGANVWRGPGLSDAWHITSLKGVFFKLSVPWVGLVLLAVSVNYLIEIWLGTFFRVTFLYAVTLPLVYAISFEFLNKIISTFEVVDDLDLMRDLWKKD